LSKYSFSIGKTAGGFFLLFFYFFLGKISKVTEKEQNWWWLPSWHAIFQSGKVNTQA